MLALKSISFAYGEGDKQKVALKEVTFSVSRGEFVAIIGPNGSGKSTMVKLLGGILDPTDGAIEIDGSSADKVHIQHSKIRKNVGILFQNPENQIVANIVEDDVAFGLENLGFPREEMRSRVLSALSVIGLLEMKDSMSHTLSGGQKQRLALAGLLAMRPKYLILDEPTTMLDPVSRQDIQQQFISLCRTEKIGLVWVTHSMEEAVLADRIVVLNNGRIVKEASPFDLFSDQELLTRYGITLPIITALAKELVEAGIPLSFPILSVEELLNALIILIRAVGSRTHLKEEIT